MLSRREADVAPANRLVVNCRQPADQSGMALPQAAACREGNQSTTQISCDVLRLV